MKKGWIAGAAVLAVGAAMAGIVGYKASHVQLDGQMVARNATSLVFSGDVSENLPVLGELTCLQELDLRGTSLSGEDYEALKSLLPGCRIVYDVPFQGSSYSMDVTSLTVSALSPAEETLLESLPELKTVTLDASQPETQTLRMLAKLSVNRPDMAVSYQYPIGGQYLSSAQAWAALENVTAGELEDALTCLPHLRELALSGTLPEAGALQALEGEFPEVAFSWVWNAFGQSLSSGTESLDLSGQSLTPAELENTVGYLPHLKKLDLTDTGLSAQELAAFVQTHPEISCRYYLEFYGKTYPNDLTELDLSGQRIDDLPALEEALVCFPNLTKLILSDCGQSSEALDALDSRLPNIRVVWTVRLGGLRVRTDETTFMPVKYHKEVTDNDLVELKYCRDMVCIDVGHMKITNCDWAANMPNLQYLVIADTYVSDISPLADHKNLVFLEVFLTRVTDLSPLESCTGLDDLNLCYVNADATPISRMTWLKRLWWTQNAQAVNKLPEECRAENILPQALPDTQLNFHTGDSVGDGWRKGAHYYEMRDLLGMFYIDS